jgi:hypothetical protein
LEVFPALDGVLAIFGPVLGLVFGLGFWNFVQKLLGWVGKSGHFW